MRDRAFVEILLIHGLFHHLCMGTLDDDITTERLLLLAVLLCNGSGSGVGRAIFYLILQVCLHSFLLFIIGGLVTRFLRLRC
jgi:hypothetical protein